MASRIIRRPEVESLTGLSRSTIYKLMAEGRFPKPLKLTGKAVGWPEMAVAEWLAQRPAAYAA